MKILCVIDSLGSGGAQRQLVELAKGFKESGHDVSFLIYHDINFFRTDLDQADISVDLVSEPNYLKRIIKIRNVIRKDPPDAVLSFLEGANLIATLSGFPFKKWKLIVGERSANPNILKSSRLQLYRWFHLFADAVVANSQANLNIVKKINPLLSDKKCWVIYNITNLKVDKLMKNNLSKDKTIVTIPASYRSVKNIDGLIEGIRLLDENYKNKLIVNWYGSKGIDGGEDYYKKAFCKIGQYNLENIIILNDVSEDISNAYENSDFVALLSHFEGFPNVICEAMILGKPVITTRISDLPDIIQEGENGFLCNSKSPESIKEAFKKAIDSTIKKRKDMGSKNIKKANVLFDKNKIVEEYLTLLS